MFCKKLGIKNYGYFGLKRLRFPKVDLKKKALGTDTKSKIWLSDDKTIFSQGCDSETMLYFHHKYWFQDVAELTDEATAEYIYKEVLSFSY